MRSHVTPVRTASTRKTEITRGVEGAEDRGPSCTVGGSGTGCVHARKQ